MTKSRIQKLKEALPKDPSRVYNEALPYINAQIKHFSHLKPDTTIAIRVKRAALEAATLYKEAKIRLGFKPRMRG
ncbi:MAG: hypothetical protein AAB937_00375 [Patescibacteria group bacterium]